MSKRRGPQASVGTPGLAPQSQRRPNALPQLYALAVAQQKGGLTANAIATYRQCLSLSPKSAEIHNNLGTALEQMGQLPEAAACFKRALALDPTYVRPLVNLGKVLRLQGRAAEALKMLERALALSPDSHAALTNLGFALADLGRLEDASRRLRRAIELEPGLAEAHHGLGRVLLDVGDTAGAAESLRTAVALKPSLVDAGLLLATALLVLRRFPEALLAARRVLEQTPESADGLAVSLNCSLKMCDWGTVEHILERIRALPCGTAHTQPFLLLGVSNDPEEQLRAARRRTENAAAGRTPFPPPRYSSHDRIRLAYVSGDFHSHATSLLMAELLERHDRSSFEVMGVSFGPDDGSPLRRRVLDAFDQRLEARDKSDLEIATWLREREVDIAVDLKGYTAFARSGIFAHRAAAIQVSYLGYPGTLGTPFIDYLIADPFVVPVAEQRFYTEKIAYLPDSYQVNDSRRLIAERTPCRAEVGLPAEGLVFCCFNVNWKITPAVFDVWMRLLTQVPGSVLWLLEDNPWSHESLHREAAIRGVAPERLIFCGRTSNEDHLARHRLADLFLDTFPCNAHTTASDALWAGLPIVTCAGRTFASRVAGSLLRAVGLPELITASLEEYERLALSLALDRGKLHALRTRLQNQEALPLFDTPMFCRHLEAVYRNMQALHRAGTETESFAVARLAAGSRP